MLIKNYANTHTASYQVQNTAQMAYYYTLTHTNPNTHNDRLTKRKEGGGEGQRMVNLGFEAANDEKVSLKPNHSHPVHSIKGLDHFHRPVTHRCSHLRTNVNRLWIKLTTLETSKFWTSSNNIWFYVHFLQIHIKEGEIRCMWLLPFSSLSHTCDMTHRNVEALLCSTEPLTYQIPSSSTQ